MDICPESEYWAVVSGPPDEPELGARILGVQADMHDELARREWLGALVWTAREDAERDLQARRDLFSLTLMIRAGDEHTHEWWMAEFDARYRVQAIYRPLGDVEWYPVGQDVGA